MRSLLVVKVDLQFCRSQELAQRAVGLAFSHSEFEDPYEAFGMTIVCGRTRSAHRVLKAFLYPAVRVCCAPYQGYLNREGKTRVP